MSRGLVNKSTGERIQTAGNPLDKVGNLANLTTTAKDNAVAAINEVNAGLAGKQATLTFDNVPIDGSNNPVKSDGIYDALATKADASVVGGIINISSNSDLANLKNGYNNVKFVSGLVIGTQEANPITLANNFRGYIVRDANAGTFNGLIENYDLTETIAIGSNNISAIYYAQKIAKDSDLSTKADLTDLAPAFSTATAYTVGQYVSYDGNLYKCTSAHSAGAWVAGDFTLVAVGSELESKQPKTDNNLTTTSKDTTGAINELKSGLNNVADDAKLNTQDLTTPSRSKNIWAILIDKLKEKNNTGTWNGNTYSIAGVSFVCTVDNGYVSAIECSGNTSTYPALNISIGKLKAGNYKISMEDRFRLYEDGTQIYDSYGQADYAFTANGTSTYDVALYRGTGEIPSSTYHPMIRLASVSDSTFAPYIPSVESRIEAVESGLTKQTLTFTPATGVTLTNSNFKRQLDIVNLHLQCQKELVLDTWNELGTIPNDVRPVQNIHFEAVNMNTETPISGQIGANGHVWVYPRTGSDQAVESNILFDYTYIV